MIYIIVFILHLYESTTQIKGLECSMVDSNFLELSKTPTFVDKSMMLYQIFHGRPKVLITAPRKFGKSTNLDMIRTFFSIPQTEDEAREREFTFRRLEIYKKHPDFVKKAFGTYPVLYFNFKSNDSIRNVDDVIQFLGTRVHALFKEHEYLANSSNLNDLDKEFVRTWSDSEKYKTPLYVEVFDGMENLANLMHKHYNKTKLFLLVDEYDSIIIHAMFNLHRIYLREIINIVLGQFSDVVKRNNYADRAVVTGSSYLAGCKLTLLRSLRVYKFLHPHRYTDFYGFLDTDIAKLFKKFNITEEMAVKAKHRYDGYISKSGSKIYNPYSILSFLGTLKVDNYWRNTQRLRVIHDGFYDLDIKNSIVKLVQNTSIKIEKINYMTIKHTLQLKKIIDNLYKVDVAINAHDLFFSFLCDQGYLHFGTTCNYLSVPNLEMKTAFSSALRKHVAEKYSIEVKHLRKCSYFLENLYYNEDLENKMIRFQNYLKKVFKIFKTRQNDTLEDNIALEEDIFTVILTANKFHILYFKLTQNVNSKNDSFSLLELNMIKGDLSVILQVYHGKTEMLDSTNVLQLMLNNTKFENDKFTGKPYFLLVAISSSYNGDVSISWLVNKNCQSEIIKVTT